jgi:phage shock protein A
MSFFSRLSDMVSSNVNALLEQAENPKKALGQIVAEMERGVESARKSATSALANAKRLKAELDLYRSKIAFWDEKARAAVALGRDDLARRALARRRELADLAGALEQQYDAALTLVENLKTTLWALEARLAETIRRQTSGGQAADEPAAAAPASAPAPAPDPATQSAQIAALEREMAEAEIEIVAATAAAQAESQLEQAKRELEGRLDLEAELAALKRDAKA